MNDCRLVDIVKDRAMMMRGVREFFFDKGVVEVDCKAMRKFPSLDLNVEPMSVNCGDGQKMYMHTSPEYGMKKLLSCGVGDCFQLSHVFRKGDFGVIHNEEFAMLEWYREGFSFDDIVRETVEVLKIFLGDKEVVEKSYREVFREIANIDPWNIVEKMPDFCCGDICCFLDYVFVDRIEKGIDKDVFFVIKDFPVEMAALSKVRRAGYGDVANRFEIFVDGIELANGYEELTDVEEHLKRFNAIREKRKETNKENLAIDDDFMGVVSRGIPDCCGVAMGFDRAMMLRWGVSKIEDIMPPSV